MEITGSLLPTSVTYSDEFLSSGAKLPNLLDIQKGFDENVEGNDIYLRNGEADNRVNQLLDKAANGSTFQEIAQAHIELNKLEKFSISNEQQVHNGEVSRAYDEAVASNAFRLAESWLDYMASLKKLQQAIEKKFGVKLKDYEDAYTAENQLSSPKIC